MNKKKMGRFLRKLREEKGLSQEKLVEEFEKVYFAVSTNAISSWENGKSIPDIDKLNFLCDFYNVTIDDILNGEKIEDIDFEEKYNIHKHDFMLMNFVMRRNKDKESNAVYEYITDLGSIIRTRFKKHIISLINGNISSIDLKELSFFLKNYYSLDENFNVSSYFVFLRRLKRKKLSVEEKWWEAQRYVFPIVYLRLTFGNLSDEGFKYKTNQKRMNYSEDWEKDALLSMIQLTDAVLIDPNDYNAKFIEKYEKEHGKKFDREQITKDTIRYLIENGAMINREFLSYQKGDAHSTRIIDTLEKAHNAIVKPLQFCVKDDEKLKFYFSENNRRNRLFVDYEYEIIKPLRKLGYTYDQIFDMVDNNEKIPNEVYLKAAKLKGIDTNRDIRFIIADTKIKAELLYLEDKWKQYRDEEYRTNPLYQDDLELMGKDLSNGETENVHITFSWVGGSTANEKLDYIFRKKPTMTYSDFIKGRRPNRTKELLESLDSLNLAQIRNKFFQIGGQEND